MAKKVVCTACGQANMQPTADLCADENSRLVDWVCLNPECRHTEKCRCLHRQPSKGKSRSWKHKQKVKLELL